MNPSLIKDLELSKAMLDKSFSESTVERVLDLELSDGEDRYFLNKMWELMQNPNTTEQDLLELVRQLERMLDTQEQ